MKPRKRHLTARIKPATKHALMAQLALAADVIEGLRAHNWHLRAELQHFNRPLWRRLLGLR